MNIILKAALVIVYIVCLTACSPVKVTPDCKYLVGCVPDRICGRKPLAKTLMILPPMTYSPYNTTQMAYTKRRFKVSYYSRNRWVTTPGQMLLPLLVQTMQTSHAFHAVLEPPVVELYDYVLSTNILRFEQDFVCCPPVAVVMIRAQLSDAIVNHPIATKDFIVTVPLKRCPPYGGVLAMNCAVCQILGDIRDFVIHETRKRG